jgi:hypothetical protein
MKPPAQQPAREVAEGPRDKLVQSGVKRIQQAIEIAGPPPWHQIDPNVEGLRHRPDRFYREGGYVPAFEPGNRGPRNARHPREIRMAKTTPETDRP